MNSLFDIIFSFATKENTSHPSNTEKKNQLYEAIKRQKCYSYIYFHEACCFWRLTAAGICKSTYWMICLLQIMAILLLLHFHPLHIDQNRTRLIGTFTFLMTCPALSASACCNKPSATSIEYSSNIFLNFHIHFEYMSFQLFILGFFFICHWQFARLSNSL